MAISNILTQEWNNERLGDIQDALQALLVQMNNDINGVKAKKVADINLSIDEGTTILRATVFFADETEANATVDIEGIVDALDIAVEVVNSLYSTDTQKALSAAAGNELDNKASVVFKHMHWVEDSSSPNVGVGSHERYYCPENHTIYHFYGRILGSELTTTTLSYQPSKEVVYYDLETSTAWRWNGTAMVLAVHPPYFMIADSTSGTIGDYNPQSVGSDAYPRLVWFSALSKLVYLYMDGQTRRYVAFDPDPNRVYVRLGTSPKVVQWSGSAWVDVIDISSKANAADVASTYATKSELTQGLNDKQDALQFDDAPTEGSIKPVKSGGIYTALQTLLGNIHIGANGNWWVGPETNQNNDTGIKAQGPTGNVEFEDLEDLVALLVNDLSTGGAGNFLSAEMGLILRRNVAIVAGKVDSLINALAGIAFVGDRVAPIGQLDWEGAAQTVYNVTANFTGCDATDSLPATVNELATLSFTLEAETGYSLPYGVKVTVGGSPVAASYNRATGAVSIDAILGDVVIEAVAIDEDNIAYEGVMIEPVGTTGGYLHVGSGETSYISHLIDLGASRSASVAVKYVGGAIAKYDSSGNYIGYAATAATEATVGIDTSTRYIRLFGETASMGDGVVKVDGVVMFDGSAVGNDDKGDADDFFASDYCPQPNADGDYVGWLFCKKATAFNGWSNSDSDPRIGDDIKMQLHSMVTAIGTTTQIPWVMGKMVDLPAYVNSTLKRPTEFSAGEFAASNGTLPAGILYDNNGVGVSYVALGSTNNGMNSTTRVRTMAIGEDRYKARIVCSITAYNASRSTETTPTYFTFIANSQTNEVLWGNDSPITNS